MKRITLSVDKGRVYEEAAKTTDYNGSKNDADDRRDKVLITDADNVMLERFWAESASAVNERVKPFLVSVTDPGDNSYSVELEMSNSYDTTLTPSVNSSLFSYFATSVISKWMEFSDKGDAKGYAENAAAMLTDVMRKLYYKKKPVRPTYDN